MYVRKTPIQRDPFKFGRCSKCGCIAHIRDLTEPDAFFGIKSVHRPGPRGGDKCKAIQRKKSWKMKLYWRNKKREQEFLKEVALIP